MSTFVDIKPFYRGRAKIEIEHWLKSILRNDGMKNR